MAPRSESGRSRAPRNPPSCRSCRLKKLKCDREQPCANCRTRQLTCEYARNHHTATPQASGRNKANEPRTDSDAIRTRLARLERAVFGNVRDDPPLSSAGTSLSSPMRLTEDNRAAVDSEWLEHRINHQGAAAVIALDTDDLITAASVAGEVTVAIPTKHRSLTCLTQYEESVAATLPIIHHPSVRNMLVKLYEELYVGKPPDPGGVALLLAICVSVILWRPAKDTEHDSSFSAFTNAVTLSKQALLVFDKARVSGQISLELIQAVIILNFCLVNIVGMSPHNRLLLVSAGVMARELCLHRADAPHSKFAMHMGGDPIKMEIGRRIWWHIASTDWLFAQMGNATEGVYSIHPKHMMVKYPRVLTDHDLSTQDPASVRSQDPPVAILFFLQRCNLAIVCREVVDALSDEMNNTGMSHLPSEKLAVLDAKFRDLLDAIPEPLRLRESNQTTNEIPSQNADACLLQMLINVFIHSRRCKLHLPYLVRSQFGSTHAWSRQICLQSARMIVQIRDLFRSQVSDDAYAVTFLQGGTLSHIFYAAIVLVMDLCINSSRDQAALDEAYGIIQILEEIQVSSTVASDYLQSLTEILRKHQVKFPSTESTHRTISRSRTRGVVEKSSSRSDASSYAEPAASGRINAQEPVMSEAGGFGDIWNDFLYNGSTLDPQGWDAIMKDLEMHIG